jgi:hypothetical protein
MRDDVQSLLAAAEQLPRAQLPELLGQIETVRVTAIARLTTTEPITSSDELVGIGTAADRLGMSESYLYKNHGRFSFTRRIGNKLLFSTTEIAAFFAKTSAKSQKRIHFSHRSHSNGNGKKEEEISEDRREEQRQWPTVHTHRKPVHLVWLLLARQGIPRVNEDGRFPTSREVSSQETTRNRGRRDRGAEFRRTATGAHPSKRIA